MINITRGEANENIALTLYEKSTLTTPYYLFKFTSVATKESEYFVATDTSTQKQRYNKFTITETSSNPDNTDGQVTLDPAGQWFYTVYEQSSSTNLDPENASVVGIVEEGQAWVTESTAADTYHDPETTDIIHE